MGNDTLLITLTAGQLHALIRDAVSDAVERKIKERMPKSTVKGIKGLATILRVSTTYAQTLKTQGVFDGAITQNARTIIVDVVKAQQIWEEYANK